MSAWLEYLQREVSDDVLAYIPDKLINLTLRCRNGAAALADPETSDDKKPEYQILLRKLKAQRDFFAALLRYRDYELPSVLGPRWDKKDMDEAVEAVFQRHVRWIQYWYPTGEMGLDENKEQAQMIRDISNEIYATEEGKRLMSEAFDRFGAGYDYSDFPMFYKDICVAINAIGKYQLAVWDRFYSKEKAALKQPNPPGEKPKEENQ